MAPLVPNMISPEFDFVIAFLMGIGFGFMLEQAGFSSTRKLVGLFYGYDFTVLKVFFTAGVTAMVGVLLFGHLGWLNLEAIYINPMFIDSAIIGGLIMGAGFIMGGFCPGTSLCALAVGRIDAFFFVIGSVIGILGFTEFYPAFEEMYVAGNMGSPTINSVLGMSPEAFGILLTVIAVAAFVGTNWIQKKFYHNTEKLTHDLKRNYIIASVVPVVLILLIWITPSKNEMLWSSVEERYTNADYHFETMDVDKLAFELMYHAYDYTVIDVSDKDTLKEEIPTAIHIKYSEMDKPQYYQTLVQHYKRIIFVSNDSELSKKAAILAEERGGKSPIVYLGTVSDFRAEIFAATPAPDKTQKSDWDLWRFRQDASAKLKAIEARLRKMQAPPEMVVKKAKGGCA
ncbi:sulfurtransferase [bacterium]|nr:MAG: sulfurtransferase [bacterium]